MLIKWLMNMLSPYSVIELPPQLAIMVSPWILITTSGLAWVSLIGCVPKP